MADVGAVGGNDGLNEMVAKIKDLQSQRAEVHRAERSKFLEKQTGSPLLGQKISGLGQSIDRFA
ncbi:hypothetical protein MNBD_NITROSPINAE02-1291 [hydrothermal vent metagenome]|uniref:Uncharacterized protein n=1 Tax=hydrothermal vent metagenome TaxID=652676 RepID=A0A3B1BWR9_9ZZZZ